MAEYLALNADALMARLEGRFGVAATYVKQGTPGVSAAGDLTANETAIACTVLPDTVTARDLALVGAAEGTLKAWKARSSILGLTGLSPHDELRSAEGAEVVLRAEHDGLAVWRILTRKFA